MKSGQACFCRWTGDGGRQGEVRTCAFPTVLRRRGHVDVRAGFFSRLEGGSTSPLAQALGRVVFVHSFNVLGVLEGGKWFSG